MPTTKTYTPLVSLTRTRIKNCSAVLPNHMQCWRAGDFQVVETTVQPAVAATKDTPAIEEKVEHNEYQLCAFHKALEEQEQLDALTKQPTKPAA